MANIRNLTTWWAGAVSISPRNVEAAVVNSLEGALAVTFLVAVPDAASGDVDVAVPFAARVIDVRAVKTGGAGAASNTITVKNATTAITDAFDMNVADKVVVRAATLDDASWELAAGGTLRVSWAKSGGNSAASVEIRCVRV